MLVQNTDMIYVGSDPMARAWRGDEAIVWEPGYHNYAQDYFTMEIITGGTMILRAGSSYYYSLNGGAWQDLDTTWSVYSNDCRSYTLNDGDVIRFKGSNASASSFGNARFGLTIRANVYGNIASLVCGDSFTGVTEGSGYTFTNLFERTSGIGSPFIVNARYLVLPFWTGASSIYSMMFYEQEELVTAPEHIFLREIPHMGCNAMFAGCDALVTAPQIHARTLASTGDSHCMRMFKDCGNLVNQPGALRPKNVYTNSYNEMFLNCYALEEAPVIYADDINSSGALNSMFKNCGNLEYVKAMFTTEPGSYCTADWMSGVAQTGVFVKNPEASWDVRGVNGVPTGWTIQDAS